MSKGIEGEGFVSTPTVADILSTKGNISINLIVLLAKRKVLTPMTGDNEIKYWGAENIFRIFCFGILLEEYNQKNRIKGRNTVEDYQEVYRNVVRKTFGKKYKDFTCRDDWRVVTEAARKEGIIFDLTKYKYTPKT